MAEEPQTDVASDATAPEVEDDENEDVPLDVPPDRRTLVCDKTDFEVDSLYTHEKNGRLDCQPYFQREYVWDRPTASRLVESVLMNVPIPVVYLAEDDDGNYLVVDGQQRLRSLFDFMDGKFALQKLSVLTEFDHKRFPDLDTRRQNMIRNTSLRCIVIKAASHPDIKFEIFERLNAGSVKLNSQELRNCVYRGPLTNLIGELIKEPAWATVTGWRVPDKRMRDREAVLRFIALYDAYNKYQTPMKRFLNNVMKDRRNSSEEVLDDFRRVFRKALSLTHTVFGANAFRRFSIGNASDPNGVWERSINMALFDAVMLGWTHYETSQVTPNADGIREALIGLMTTNAEFTQAIELGTSQRTRLDARVTMWKTALKDVIGTASQGPRSFPRELRDSLFDQNPVCALCGQRIVVRDDAQVDHVAAYSTGGATTPGNAALSHRYCNIAKGAGT